MDFAPDLTGVDPMGHRAGLFPVQDCPLWVSLVIPARDEAKSLVHLLSQVKDGLSGCGYEIIVVDDGSKDGTREIAWRNGALVISHPSNRGKGAAMKTGVENARGNIIVFLDGDGAHDPQDIANLIGPILQREADLVIGSRVLPGSRVPGSPVSRRLCNNLASFVISGAISLLLPLATLLKCPVKWIRITDCTSGFRAIRKEGWEKLALASEGFQIETEMIYEAVKNGLTIAEAPIGCNWDNRLSHLSILKDGWKTVMLLARKLLADLLSALSEFALRKACSQGRPEQ